MSRRIAFVVASFLLFAGFVASPAAADRPVEFTDSVTFVDTNPCTGLDHEITLNSEVRLHQHDGRIVVHVKRTGNTDTGYVLEHGVLNLQDNGNVVSQAFSDKWTRADGSKFKAKGTFVLDLSTDTVRVDRFSLSCIKA